MTTLDVPSLLRQSFDYDLYANRCWLPYIVSADLPEETKVFKHVLAASKVWALRLDGVSLPSMPDVLISEELLEELHAKWCAATERFSYEEPINYTNTKGEPYCRNFGDIAQHVVNHGTYHRGELRGMFERGGLEFPETDFILYTFGRDEPV